jgi:putative ABC transport system permease protein
VVGASIAGVGLKLLPALTTDLPRLNEVAFDWRALAFITALTVFSALVSGLPQAWRRTRVSPQAALSSGTLRTTGGAERHWLRDGFVVLQVAMAAILMTGSGLLVRSFLQLRAVDPGFDPRGVLVAPVFLDSQAYSGEKARTYYRTLFEKLSALPGVSAVGGATTVPTSPVGPAGDRPVWPQESGGDAARKMLATVRVVTPGYVKTLGLRIAEGRPFDDRDAADGPRVIMVNETLARRVWPGQSAVGKQLVIDYAAGTYPYEVVGVVGNLRFRGPRSEPVPEFYQPHAQRPYLILNVVVKTAGDPLALIPQVRAALMSIDPQKPAQGLYALQALLGATYSRDRQTMLTLLVFALAASCLAVLSVYGVLSQRVRERSREIGIRIAMGANAANVVSWVAASGLRLIAAGLLIGAVAARALSSALSGIVFGIATSDPLTAAAACVVLATIGMAATLLPSWRAARIDPVEVLKRSS